MTRVVVDASVILAGLLRDGTTRSVLLGQHDLILYTPAAVTDEIERHLAEMVERSHVSKESVVVVLDQIRAGLEVVPTETFARYLPSARRRVARAHALHDEAYVALADALAAPIWSYDKDFRRVDGVTVLSTKEVLRLAGLSRS
ncbi:MAG: PIN domain-containing protein [Thermoplasmata archaeon]|nr:PIN domain-containing protein [Thermoplasmata archaeon]MCI4361599.1 PIN domain-containing protein [Thermoplasmata archaeon]